MTRRIHVHMHKTRDAFVSTGGSGKFDESKHKRDGGKFARTEGTKSESNAEHSAKAAPHAEAVRKEGENSIKGKAHNEALGAWAEARKLLDPDKPMAEQSAEYKKAVAVAEDLSAKAAQLRRVPEGAEQPQGAPKPQGKGKPAPGQKKRPSASGGGNEVRQAGAVLKRIKRVAEENDPDRKGGR